MWKPTLLHRCQYLPKLITENYWLIMNPLAQRLLTCTLILGEEVPFVLVEVKHYTYTYTSTSTYTYIYIYIYIYIYNHDRLHRICPISTLRVWTEKKLRIFGVEIFGVKFWSA